LNLYQSTRKMKRLYKLIWAVIFTLSFQSTSFAVDIKQDSISWIQKTKLNTEIQNTNNTVLTSNFSDIPLKIFISDTVMIDGVPIYQSCFVPQSAITLSNNAPDPSKNSNYSIKWGDNSADFSVASWDNTTHQYPARLEPYTLVYSFDYPDGSKFQKEYKIYVRSKPAFSFGTEGLTDNCVGFDIFFPIKGTEGNSPDTKYKIIFNDGSDTINYNPADGNGGIFHKFVKSSCGTVSSSYQNAFSAKVIAKNACGISEVSVVPIYVSSAPVVGFSVPVSKNNLSNNYPSNSPIKIIDTTTGFVNVNGNCSAIPKLVWIITPNTGFYLTSGETLGKDYGLDNSEFWVGGTKTITPTFTAPGTYTIKLRVDTKRCGNNFIEKTICIEDPLTSSFSLDSYTGCNPLTVKATNTTNLSKTCASETNWEVTYTASNCGNNGNWSFANGSSNNSQNPSFIFNTPGTYKIKLTMTNTAGSSIIEKTVKIKQPPTATINQIADFCGIANFTPVVVVNSCDDNPENLTYNWTFEGGTPTSSDLKTPGKINYGKVGEYTVKLSVTNSCGTTAIVSNSFKVNPIPTINPVDNQTKCVGEFSDKIVFEGTNADVFEWTNSNASIGLQLTGKGNINAFELHNNNNKVTSSDITVTPKNSITGCIGTPTIFKINVNPKAVMDSIGNQVLNNGDMTAAVIFTTKNTGGITTYNWTNNNPTNELGESGAGNIPSFKSKNSSNSLQVYTITVTPTYKNGGVSCVGASRSFTITICPSAQINRPMSIELCNGAYNPDIAFNTNNTVGVTTYSWTNSNPTIGLAESGNGSIKSFKLINKSDVHISAIITVTPTFSYNGITNIGDTVQFKITADPGPDFIEQPLSSYICRGGDATPMTVNTKGGVGNPSYQWYSNSEKSYNGSTSIENATNATFNPPVDKSGTIYYYCTVSLEAGKCKIINSEIATVSINEAAVISKHPKLHQNLCVGGTIKEPLSVEYNGGNGTASYQWYSIKNNVQTAIDGATDSIFTPSVFTIAGTYYYNVIVTLSGDNCEPKTSNTSEINVVNDPNIKQQPLVSQTVCLNTAATNLEVIPQGGVESIRYQYQWYSNSINSINNAKIIAGATDSIYTPKTDSIKTKYYYCNVYQDSLSCNVVSETAMVTVNPNPTITSHFRDTTICINESIPALSISIFGGVGTPTYQWYVSDENNYDVGTAIPDATKSTFLPPTSTADTLYYYCQISGFTGGCNSIISEISCIKVTPKAIISSQNLSICSGQSFNYIKSQTDYIPDGTNYTWSAPTIIPANAITGAIAATNPTSYISQKLINTTNKLATVTYTVTPISGSCNGTPFTVSVEVIPQIITTVDLKNSNCFNANNGSITTTVFGGKPISVENPYSFAWEGPNGFTSNKMDISNLAPGEYTFTITDNSSCPFIAKYSIMEPAEISINIDSKKDINCYGDNTGEIMITVSGGTSEYRYNWTKNGIKYSTAEDLINLTAGKYVVTVNDANNCETQLDTIFLTESEELTASIVKKDILCFGNNTGEITVEVKGGVVFDSENDYHYRWSGPNNFLSNEKKCTNLVAGVYELIVTDQNNCSKKIPVYLTHPDELKLNVKSTAITCYGSNNGTITANITGGTAPYVIVWSNYANGTELTNLKPGEYTITVTDANNCIKSEAITISEAEFSIQPTFKNVSCNGANDGSINLNIKGGVLPVKVSWDDDPTAGSVRNNLSAGTYTAYLQDGAPCTITETFEILQPDSLIITGKIKNAFDCDNPNSGGITTAVTGGTTPYSYKWSNGNNTENLNDIQAGIYTVIITDAHGCSSSAKFKVTRQKALIVYVTTTTDYYCETKKYKNTNIAHVSGGLSPYQYSWSSGSVNSENNSIMESDQNNVVVLQVTDALGCSAEYTISDNNPVELPTVEIDYQLVDCTNYSFLFDVAGINLTSDNYTYSWDFGDGVTSSSKSILHNYKTAGNYKVTLTMWNGYCNSYFERMINVDPLPKVKLDKDPILCKGGATVFYASGASSYRWSDGSRGDSIILSQIGDYSVIGTSKSGCKDTLYFSTTYHQLLNYSILTDRIEVEVNTPLHLWSENIAYSTYLWDFGDGTPYTDGLNVEHTFNSAPEGYYDVTLHVTNPNGCVETATKRIWITIPTKPSIITPNGDGVNDVFMKDSYLKLYNRNGVLIYQGTSGWDGTFNNKIVENGTYFYVLTFSTEYGVSTKNGYVTLVK